MPEQTLPKTLAPAHASGTPLMHPACIRSTAFLFAVSLQQTSIDSQLGRFTSLREWCDQLEMANRARQAHQLRIQLAQAEQAPQLLRQCKAKKSASLSLVFSAIRGRRKSEASVDVQCYFSTTGTVGSPGRDKDGRIRSLE